MHFEIVGGIADVETIATGSGIRELARLRKRYGRGRWRKRRGTADVRLSGGEIVRAEIHWLRSDRYRQAGIQDQVLRMR